MAFNPSQSLSQSVLGRSDVNVNVNGFEQIPGAPSIAEQLQRIKNSWDPSSPDCAFQYYFYNKVPAEQAALYVKPANQDASKWEAAVARRPDAGSVPVLACGFSDLSRRVEQQERQVAAYRARMHDINAKLVELIARHDLSTTVKTAELRAKHVQVAHRTMRLARKIEVLRSRGYALRPAEEDLRRQLEILIRAVEDPAVFGKMNEVWARLSVVRDRVAEVANGGSDPQQQLQQQAAIEWDDEEGIEKIARILKAQQAGLVYLAEILRTDREEVETMIR
ncbi:nucleoporin complex subunit 54-domain-containing protein [Lipomyces japonicus]|uniref:nucleoporin complex subunit 54-domain-containing protein n=1 Tax=Lipomyces japonicus TaxID=56871 RepID=UPI0034CD3F45